MNWQAAEFWQTEGERLLCWLCPFRCALADAGTGLCKVRRRSGDTLETATFASAVQHLHPIERKPLYHFRPGRMALTLAAPDCNFRCDYCQNARISQYGRDASIEWNAQAIDPAEWVNEAANQGALLALSYSEPVLAAELTLALWAKARPVGVEIVWKTNGFVTQEALACLAADLPQQCWRRDSRRCDPSRSIGAVAGKFGCENDRADVVWIALPLKRWGD